MVTKLMMIGLLSALPSSAIAQSPCGGPRELTVCESELYEAGVAWEGRAREVRAGLSGCIQKLKVATSTVVRGLFIPPAPELKATWRHDAVLLGLASASGLGIGVVLGILLAR